jgi:hypothetical protein
LAAEARRYPSLEKIQSSLGGRLEVIAVPIPWDCRDGFNEAYYGRPEKYLDAGARLACSAWSFVDHAASARSVERLHRDISEGAWDATHGALRTQPEFDGSLRLMVARG